LGKSPNREGEFGAKVKTPLEPPSKIRKAERRHLKGRMKTRVQAQGVREKALIA